jgi:hypothetical protein
MQAKELRRRIAAEPAGVGPDSVSTLAAALADPKHYRESNARFLYLEISRALAELAVLTPAPDIRRDCLDVLKDTVSGGNDKSILAAGEALGSLPPGLPLRDVPGPARGGPPHATLERIIEDAGVSPVAPPAFQGRTLVFPIREGGALSIKPARRGPGPARRLHREAAWMDELAREGCPPEFHLPRPVLFRGRYVFRLVRGGARKPPRDLPRDSLAIAFIAPPGYYEYPNDHRPGHRPAPERFLSMMAMNAMLLGHLAGRGIMHTAAAPLFHNRIQGARRPDRGAYEWRRMGRLDRWLESGRYPNFGASGLRDFEHLEPLKFDRAQHPRAGEVLASPELGHIIGDHALALLLVAGGYFRAARPDLEGLDENSEPVDARSLFDKDLLVRTIEAVFHAYVRGFSGLPPHGPCPLDSDNLADRMIEEMGVDNYMEEVIRARDQNDMSRERFRNLLVRGGYSPSEADKLRPGEADATILTGPHLGGFNSQTSLPELSLFSAALAGLAVASRFENRPAC